MGLSEEELLETRRVYKEVNSCRKAGELLGIDESNVRRRLRRLRKLEAEKGVPEGHYLKGTSALYDSEGNKKLEWVKTNIELDKTREIIASAVESLKKDIEPQKPIKRPEHTDDDLLNLYVITDYHFGMMAWDGESGETWNIEEAKKTLISWFQRAIESTPDSRVGVLCQLGDFLHYDSLKALTPTSGHVLDTDAKYPQIVDAVIDVLRIVINMLLEKHEEVHIKMCEGNHDLASSVWLRALFSRLYEFESRVTVDNSHTPYYSYQFDDVVLFFHHGHMRKMSNMTEAFIALFRTMYGMTKYAYAHCGHRHHKHVQESGMMIIEQHQTLCAKDSHSVRGGYNSERSATAITYHRKHGEVSRVTIRPEINYAG